MSILIKGMEMPYGCADCDFCGGIIMPDGIYCCDCPTEASHGKNISDAINNDTRADFCPLVEIPTPHGVLKDTTAFDERIRDRYCKKCERRFGIKNGKRKEVYEIGDVPCRACDIGDMLDWLDDAPTVIETEDGI